jgi:hypothetical protein
MHTASLYCARFRFFQRLSSRSPLRVCCAMSCPDRNPLDLFSNHSIHPQRGVIRQSVGSIDLRSDTDPTILLFHDSLGCVDLWREFPQQLAQRLKPGNVIQ